jgi:hypothetical protein
VEAAPASDGSVYQEYVITTKGRALLPCASLGLPRCSAMHIAELSVYVTILGLLILFF